MLRIREGGLTYFDSWAMLIHRQRESTMTKKQKAEQAAEAIASLRKILKPGDTIDCIIRHVSSSGMSRRIDFYRSRPYPRRKGGDCSRPYLTTLMARAMDYRVHANGGMIVEGCGMDMGFHCVYNLGATLWPKGTPKPHGIRNGEPDSSGGYALNHHWLWGGEHGDATIGYGRNENPAE